MNNLASIVDQFEGFAQTSSGELLEGSARYRAMFDALPAAIYTTDAKGKITYYNPACVGFSGRTPELGSDHWCVTWKLYHPDGRPMPHAECPMAVALKEGRTIRGAEAIAERPDGKRIWFTPYPSPLRNAGGAIVGGINMLVEITERKLHEATLRRSEQELADFFDNASVALHCVGPDGTILRVNQAELDLLGYQREEYLGRNIAEFHTDQASIADILSRLHSDNVVHNYEAGLKCRDGSVKTVLIDSSVCRDEGRFIHTRCFTRDITDSRKAEMAVRANEEQCRSLFEAMNEGYCVVEMKFDEKDRPVDYRFLETNRVFEKQTGIKNAKGRWMREIAPAHEEHWYEIYGRIAKTGDTLRFERPAAALGRDYEGCACRVGDPRLGHVAIVFNDITTRKQMEAQMEAELAASELLHKVSTELIRDGKMEAVYETIMGAAVAIMRSDFGSMQRLHPERGSGGELNLLAFHGFSPEAARFWEWVRADSNCSCGAVLKCGHRVIVPDVASCDFMAGTKDQIAYQQAGMQAAQSTPLISRNGRLLGMISTHWKQPHTPTARDLRLLDVLARQTADLIERTEVADQLRQAKNDADDASRAKDKFLAVLSHELRTPLTPVLLTASELENRADVPDSFREDLGMIRRNVELQSKLIDDLLDMSRIMNGKLSLDADRVSLNQAVTRAHEICRSTIRERGVHLSLDLADELPEVCGDTARVQQVLWNLLSNAAKFTPAGGHIYVRTEKGDGVVRVVVRDTGRGIEVGKIGRVFDAFEQGEVGITREFGGLGLGLAICRAIVEQHRGIIMASSNGSGCGATFTVELPALSPSPRSGSSATRGEQAGAMRLMQILVVEDHNDTARVLARMLTARGHVVKTAGTGAEALAHLEQHSFDVILSDLGLPDMHGADLMRQIRTRLPLKGIAMSGYGMEEDIHRSREAGFEEHLVKPVKLERLEAALRRIASAETAAGQPSRA